MKYIAIVLVLLLTACDVPPSQTVYVCDEHASRPVWIGKMLTMQPYCIRGHGEHNPAYDKWLAEHNLEEKK